MTPSVLWLPHRSGVTRSLWNKTPRVTPWLWVVLVLCPPVGEAAVDWLNGTLALGLTYSTFLMTSLLVLALAVQLGVHSYLPPVYWTVVGLVSVVGTLVLADLTQTLGVPPMVVAVVSVLMLGVTLAMGLGRPASSVRRREGFYWLTVLLSFVLATTVAAQLRLGYAATGVAVATVVTGILLLVSFLNRAANDAKAIKPAA